MSLDRHLARSSMRLTWTLMTWTLMTGTLMTGTLMTGTLTLGSALLPTAAHASQHRPDLDAWRSPVPEAPAAVLVRGATIWTNGPDGVLQDADLLVRDGKIAAVGNGLEAPADALEIDGTGLHVTPGIIDPHSHIAMDSSTNESTTIVTAQVRVEDVLDPYDIAIYRQLAGGTTAAHIMHGSANSIGGQNAVIKLRWGAGVDALRFVDAPPTIKFALGENPKRASSDTSTRFPRSRMGVAQSIRDALQAALDYRQAWQSYDERTAAGERDLVPPRRDLQLDALLEVLDGQRWVHAHSYRADEILMLLRTAEDFGFQVRVLQHVLEGYKVADEIAAHGAGASTFSDWWAFKYEVIDAIPYNAAIMHERGVLVTFNSDSAELGRRLNAEAAKAVRYGGMSEEDALKLVTLNPAIQLGVDDRVGSLEAGKDADFVLWTGHPLSTLSRCEQTWIDGRPYFDRQRDLEARKQWHAERQALLAKVRALHGTPDTVEDADAVPATTDESPTLTAQPPPEPAYLEVLQDGHGAEGCGEAHP